MLVVACDFGIDLTGLDDGGADAAPDAAFDALNDGPVPDAPIPTMPVAQVGVGVSHVCVVRQDGSVACWGTNFYGQIGNGFSSDTSTPALVLGLNDATSSSM